MPDAFSLEQFGSLSATAVLGWYAWHTAYHAIPNLVKAFREEMAAMRSECAAERDALHAELSAERTQRHADHMLVVEALHDLARRLPTAG